MAHDKKSLAKAATGTRQRNSMNLRRVTVAKKKVAAGKATTAGKRKAFGTRDPLPNARKMPTSHRRKQRRGVMSQAGEKGKETYPMKPEAIKAKRGPVPSAMAGVVEEGEGNIEKIRDILFGSQMRNLEKRLSRTEERLIKEVSDLRGETWKRLDSLEGFLKKEVESLLDRIKTEQGSRTQALSELTKELKETVKTFEKKLTQVDDQISKTSRDLRQQILDQSKSLSEDARRKNQEVLAALELVAQELRADKIDRSALSELLTEMALRISGDASLDLKSVAKELK
jgi:hypothetical protein